MDASTNIALEVFCIIISFLIMIFFLLERAKTSRIDKYFIVMLTVNIVALTADMSSFTFEGNPNCIALLYFVKVLTYFCGYALFGMYIEYTTEYIGMYGHVPRKLTMIGTGIALVYEILMVVELFRHYLFIVDDAGYYVKSPVIWVVSGSGTFLLFCFLIFILVWARNMLETSMLISLLSFAALPTIAGIVQLITKNTALVYVGVTLSLLVVYSTIHKDTVNKLESAKNELEEARLNLMFSQIRPHFMYNSLTAIAQLCTIDPKRAQRATIDFSNYLRGNLDSVNYTQPIPFSQELKHLKTYLSLELMRFDDKLSVEYDIETEDFLVPVLSVQPLVENAVKHGICKKRDGGTVKISTRETEDSYIVEVADDGTGFDPNAPLDDSKSHIGVSSVRRRIESMMGGTLEIVSEVGVGTHSVLTIPKGKEQE